MRRFVLAFGVFAVLLVVAYLTRSFTLHPLACSTAKKFAPRFGYDVHIESLSGDWFSHLVLEGVSVGKTGDPGPLQSAEVSQVEVDLDLMTVLSGDLSGLREVRVGTVKVEVDLGEEAPAEGASAEPSEPTDPIPDWLPLVQVESLDANLTLASGESVLVRGAGVSATRSDEGITYQLAVHETQLEGEFPWASPLNAQIHVDGQQVRLEELALHEPLPGKIDVFLADFKDGEIGWDLDLRVLDGHAVTSGTLRGESLSASVVLEELKLSKVHELLDAPWAQDLVGEVKLDVQLTADLANPDATVIEGEVDARSVGWRGRKLDTVYMQGRVVDAIASLSRLEATAGADRIVGSEIVVPFGSGPTVLREESRGKLNIEVTNLEPWIHGADAPETPLPSHRILLDANVAGGQATFTGGEVAVADGLARIDSGTFRFPGDGDDGHLDLAATLDFENLAPVGELLGQDDWSGSTRGELRLEGPPTALVGHANLDGEQVRLAGFDLGTVKVEATSNGAEVQLASASAMTDDLQFSLSGGYVIADQTLEGIALDLEIVRPHRFADLLAPGGRLSVSARADGHWSAPTGTLDVEGLDLVAAGAPIEGLTIHGKTAEGRFHLDDLRCTTPYGELTTALSVTLPQPDQLDAPLQLDLTGFSLTSGAHQLALEESASLTVHGETIDLTGLRLAGSAGSVELSAYYDPDTLRAEYSLEDLAVLPFLGDLVPPETTPFLIGGAGEIASGRMQGDLRVHALGTELANLELSLPFEVADPLGPGEVSITGRVDLPKDHPFPLDVSEIPTELHGDFHANLDLSGTWQSLTGEVVVDGRELWATPEERITPYLESPATAQLKLIVGESDIRLETLDVDLPSRGALKGAGTIAMGLDVAALAGGGAKDLLDTHIDLAGDLAIEDLAWLTLVTDAVRRIEGGASGSLSVQGPMKDPTIDAELRYTDGSVKVAGAPELEAFNLFVDVEDGQLTIRDTGWEMGAAPVQLAGTVDLSSDPIAIDVRMTGEEVLLSRSATQRIRGDLDLSVSGPPEALKIGGEVSLRHSRLLQEIDFLGALQGGGSVQSHKRGLPLPSFRDGPLSTAEFDLKVTTTEPLRLLSNVARANVRLDLGIGGTGEVLVPSGRVFLDDLKARLPGGTVTFPLGLITFEEGNPYDPSLNLTGEARLAGYNVTMAVTGTLSAQTIEASSDPSLPQNDLMLLILSGQPPSTGGGEAAARSLGIYLAQDLAKRWMGGTSLEEDEDSFWNRLEINAGRDVSRSGTMTLEVSYRMKDAVPGPNDAIYLVAERDVWEDYNMGVRFVLRRR